jgi:hypothetical protein
MSDPRITEEQLQSIEAQINDAPGEGIIIESTVSMPYDLAHRLITEVRRLREDREVVRRIVLAAKPFIGRGEAMRRTRDVYPVKEER